ncbi:uncharacterized protein LOC109727870 [Ananas comosus]|uniref:PRAS-rich protein n=1 Tax=Ananas comosus TaxID=4615 RepID=Q8H2A8_ANACO|nr:uncharacterized protein LOC109727870 [Ananas comosus]AAM28273.1 PRAS-rich protein [Ananas comosus]
MATEILRPRAVLASVPARIRHNYRRPQSNSDPKSKPPFRKSSPKPPAADAAAAAATAAKIIKYRKTKMEEMYAGSAFSASPAPSSVPLPSFRVSRREPSSSSSSSSPPPPEKQAVDYAATRDLRRILRL